MARLRPQYHFQPSPRGGLVWNVARLVRLSSALPIQEIALSDIKEFDRNHWFADQTPTPRAVLEHAQLIAAADLRFPIILDAEGHLMDGMHRVCKAISLGHTSIKAVQFETTPEPDYVNVEASTLSYD